jgi:Glycosyl transferase family 2
MARPRISILLPIQDDRDAGVESVRSWVGGQTAAGEFYELIALAPGRDRRLEDAVRSLLRPQDRWLEIDGASSSELFNAGARDAQGEFIFLTESHCVPERDCLEAMLEELDRTGAAGVRGHDPAEARGWLGKLERDKFLEEISREEGPDHWRRVLVHSLALHRQTYLDAGGLPPRYGDFGAWVLAIELDQRGDRVAFSPRPRVRHVYDGDLRHIRAHLLTFGRGEIRFRDDAAERLAANYLGLTAEWEDRLAHTRSGARRALRSAIVLRHSGALGSALRHLAVAILGPRATVLAARIGARRAALTTRLRRNPAKRTDQFNDFWRLTTRRGRLTGLAESHRDPAEPPEAELIDLTGSLSGRAIGFHDPEPVEGEPPIRWTTALALIRVNVPGDGPTRARLELRPLQRPAKARGPRPRIAIDDRAVPATVSEDAIEFEIEPGRHWLALACAPLRPRRHGVNDHRRIGLPVRALSFERL